MATHTLTRSEVRKLSKYLRAAGYALPKPGTSVEVPVAAREAFRGPSYNGWPGRVPTRVVRGAARGVWGYYFTSWK
jgi:hypothetical protein